MVSSKFSWHLFSEMLVINEIETDHSRLTFLSRQCGPAFSEQFQALKSLKACPIDQKGYEMVRRVEYFKPFPPT